MKNEAQSNPLQDDEFYLRQQEAWKKVVELLQSINRKISKMLGIDFASDATPRRGGCCG